MSDYTTVYFTGIDHGFSVYSTLCSFTVFGRLVEIKWYGALIAVGFVLALIVASRLAKRGGINQDSFFDVVIYGTIGAIIGARAYYVIFQWNYYSQHTDEILKINEGGLAIYGGLIMALLVGALVCKIKKINMFAVFDCVSVGFLIGQGIGRWGNYTNQEAFGTNTTMPWGMTSDKVKEYIITHMDEFESRGFEMDPDVPVHPTFLYESLWCIIGAVLLYFMYCRYRKFNGQIILSYGIWYGLERVVVEGFRTDSLYIGSSSVRISQVLSGVIVVVCTALLILGFIRLKKGKIKPAVTVIPEKGKQKIDT